MGSIILIVVLAAVAALLYKMLRLPDQNGDGKVDVKDVVAAAKSVAADAVKAEKAVAEKVKKARKPRKPKQ